MNLFILRHGLAADFGDPGLPKDLKDADRPLSAKGKQRMWRITEAMRTMELTFDAVVSSPLLRARQTAQIVTEALELRRKFPELRMIGNISREALMKGRAAIEEEVRTKVPPLMAQGGYLPAFDDLLMPDMRLEDILCCAELVRGHVP